MEAYGEYRRDRTEDGAATPGLDRALFRLGLLHALPASPVHAPERARELWRELVKRFPESPYRPLVCTCSTSRGRWSGCASSSRR